MTPSRVLLVDDHPVVLKGVRHLLASTGDLEVVAEGKSGKEGLELARQELPDLIILDLRLTDCLAADLCRELRSVVPDAKVVILTAFDDPELLQACIRAGASGVLLKDVQDLDLVRTLRQVKAGEIIIDSRVLLDRGASTGGTPKDQPQARAPLTPREYDILRLMARGMTDKEIAAALHLAPNTVRGYSQALLVKLNARNRIQALGTARQLRLI
ncbi:MAG: response regulator [Actinomycetota bacterium]